eukprot:456995-Pleurochrysis_carterae.AAC.3
MRASTIMLHGLRTSVEPPRQSELKFMANRQTPSALAQQQHAYSACLKSCSFYAMTELPLAQPSTKDTAHWTSAPAKMTATPAAASKSCGRKH